MLPDKLKLEIVTPDRLVVTEGVDEVVLPSVEGYLGVLPGHAPLLARLDPGEIDYRIGSEHALLAVSGGFAEVLRDRVEILAETCEPAGEIDVERARRSLERAEKRIQSQTAEFDLKRAEISLRKAVSRINVGRRIGG